MSAAYEAVILAAGRGSRLGSTTQEYPKALLPIGPKGKGDACETSFLRRQCELLRHLDVQKIVVVVGYHKDLIVEEANRWELGIEFVENTTPDVTDSGSLHSFQFAARSSSGLLDGSRQTLLMDADIVYETDVLSRLLSAPEQTSILIHGRVAEDDEEVRVFGTAEAPRFLGKGLRPELTMGAPCLGEAVGIVKFAPKDHRLARATMDWMLGDPDAPEGSNRKNGFGPAKHRTEHEELSQRFMHYGKMSGVVVGSELLFMEVDNEREYAHLRDVLYPRLVEKEHL